MTFLGKWCIIIMNGFKIRKALFTEADLITEMRVALLNEASGPLTETEKHQLYEDNYSYISNGLSVGSLISILALNNNEPIGTCSVTLYSVMPGRKLPKGKLAYLQNMYVKPDFRNMGIAKQLLSFTVAQAVNCGHNRISLHATEAGYNLFSRFGFINENVSLTHMIYEPQQTK